jgi:hypothetical protein
MSDGEFIEGDEQEDGDWPYGADSEQNDEFETIEELMQQKRDAIKDFNFELAGEIQKRIAAMGEREVDERVRDFERQFRERCMNVAQRHRRNNRRIIKKFHDLEISERLAVTDRFQELQIEHRREIQELEKAQFEDFKKRMDRPIPKFDEMMLQAQALATRDQFEDAGVLREEARNLQTKKLDKRIKLFEENYKLQLNARLDRQRDALADLAANLVRAIERIEKQRETEIQGEVKNFAMKLGMVYQQTLGLVRLYKVDPRKPRNGDGSDAVSTVSSRSARPEDILIVNRETKPVVLKTIKTAYDEVLKQFAVTKDDTAKPASPSRVGSRAGSRFSSHSSVFRSLK